jgi:L-rhamnose isomerase
VTGVQTCALPISKGLPWGAVWDAYCESQNVPAGSDWLTEVKQYEATVLSRRG